MVLPLCFIVAYIIFVPLYVANYRWIPNPASRQEASLQAQTPGSLDLTLDIRASMSRTNMRQWHLTMAKMVNVLNVIIVGSTLALSYVPLITTSIFVRTTQPPMISTTIALFLQPFVLDNTLLRAVTASSFFLAGASFVSAFTLVASKDRMIRSRHKRDQWIEASRHPMTWTSISFWGCLTWPLTSFTW